MTSLKPKVRNKELYKETAKKYHQTKRGHVMIYMCKAKDRSKNKNLAFDLDLEYLLSIATDECPVFGTKFIWGRHQGERHRQTPSLDRVIPEYGYVKGNVVFISMWANMIKADATEKELYAVADWLHDKRKEVLKNVKQNQLTPVSGTDNREGEVYPELGSFSAPWLGEDSNNPDNHSGTDAREDADSSTQASSGDSMGHGDSEVGTPMYPKGFKDPWLD
jgi:hypothetical protein